MYKTHDYKCFENCKWLLKTTFFIYWESGKLQKKKQLKEYVYSKNLSIHMKQVKNTSKSII